MSKPFNLVTVIMSELGAPAQPFTAAWYRQTIQGVRASTRRCRSRRFTLGLRRAPRKRYLADSLGNEVVYTSAADSLRALFNAGLVASPLCAARINASRRLSDGQYHSPFINDARGLFMVEHYGSGLIVDRIFADIDEALAFIDRLVIVPELVAEIGLLKIA